MNAIQEIKDENVRKVAMTLRSSGLASSETEAVRMAMAMTKTSQRVNANFDEKNKTHYAFGTQPQQQEPSVQSQSVQARSPFSQSSTVKQQGAHTDVYYSVRKSTSVQVEPRKIEEKEEFIFGDVQEKAPVQKMDVYKVENEFEEVVVQEVITTKEAPKEMPKAEVKTEVRSFARPSMFGGHGSMPSSEVVAKNPAPQPRHEVHIEVSHSQQMPAAPASNPSQTPLTASSSAQMAFASILGSAMKTQESKNEQKPAVQSSPAQASQSRPEVSAPQTARPAMAHGQDTRANVVSVDLTKMFNVNK